MENKQQMVVCWCHCWLDLPLTQRPCLQTRLLYLPSSLVLLFPSCMHHHYHYSPVPVTLILRPSVPPPPPPLRLLTTTRSTRGFSLLFTTFLISSYSRLSDSTLC
ncbi:hypothetical protein Pcinc_040499 [Petrolisthes cinctipes]|uniref:Uncharacterized protein n=1 Tax=Petrolisthes cinctipes TaxID=88211 RepID=A0AAE1BLS6_PETCI|nr:hypothetical protein Pcinc_040499 [Petrolisthes cinctipes]